MTSNYSIQGFSSAKSVTSLLGISVREYTKWLHETDLGWEILGRGLSVPRDSSVTLLKLFRDKQTDIHLALRCEKVSEIR
jgi:hypothetical protein